MALHRSDCPDSGSARPRSIRRKASGSTGETEDRRRRARPPRRHGCFLSFRHRSPGAIQRTDVLDSSRHCSCVVAKCTTACAKRCRIALISIKIAILPPADSDGSDGHGDRDVSLRQGAARAANGDTCRCLCADFRQAGTSSQSAAAGRLSSWRRQRCGC
jgi:hypothetical protein